MILNERGLARVGTLVALSSERHVDITSKHMAKSLARIKEALIHHERSRVVIQNSWRSWNGIVTLCILCMKMSNP